MIDLVRYNSKLMFSPLKWLFCLIVVMLLPIAMYVPEFYDLVNICEIYMPLIGVILITDIMIIDEHNNIGECLYMINDNARKTFFLRYVIISSVILIFIFVSDGTFIINRYLQNNHLNDIPDFHLQFVYITFCSMLFLGTASMTIANLFKNPYLAYIFSFIYWLYWNINYEIESIFNLFPFVANPTDYGDNIIILLIFTVILIVVNSVLVGKSPFFFGDKFRKYRYI